MADANSSAFQSAAGVLAEAFVANPEMMKTKKHTDRKTAIEHVLAQARKVSTNDHEATQAWLRLIRELEFMCYPEARMPRFNGLMHTLWIAATNDHT